MAMTTPKDSAGRQHVEDAIKILITNQTTHFPAMIMPPLLDSVRGDTGELEQLLKALGGDSRGEKGHWACRNFSIRTTKQYI